MTELVRRDKLIKSHISFIAICIVVILCILAVIEDAYMYSRWFPLPEFIKYFLYQIAPFLAITLCFFFWGKDTERPNKWFLALFITFFLHVFVFGYMAQFFNKWLMNLSATERWNVPEDLPAGLKIFYVSTNWLFTINRIMQVIFAWIVLKKGSSASRMIKAAFVLFIVYMLSIFLTYHIFGFIRLMLVPDIVDTIEKYKVAEKWNIASRIIRIPYTLSRFAEILVVFPLIIDYRGEKSLWYQFRNGPLRKFLMILRPYNPNGVK